MRKPDLETVRNLLQVTGQDIDDRGPHHYSVSRTCSGTKRGEVRSGKLVLGIEAIAVWTGEGLPQFGVHGVSSLCRPWELQSRGNLQWRRNERGSVELGVVLTEGRHHDVVLVVEDTGRAPSEWGRERTSSDLPVSPLPPLLPDPQALPSHC